jgi:DNA-directed RNA polymerase specialized sigma24 family protein
VISGLPLFFLSLFGSPQRGERRMKMRIEEQRETNQQLEDGEVYETSRYKTRVVPVDMMRIEDAYDIGPLTEFEREVKDKMAVASSPYKLLAKSEEDSELANQKVQLRELAKEADLTPRQRECFQLLCEEDCSVTEAARRMGLSKRRIKKIQDQLAFRIKKYLKFLKMKRVAEKIMKNEAKAICPLHLAVLRLRYLERLPSHEIAIRLGKKRLSIDRILKLFS